MTKQIIHLELQIASKVKEIPSAAEFRRWLEAALSNRTEKHQITIRVVDEMESTKLNLAYRHKHGPTNILSFPFSAPDDLPLPILGDLIICAPLVMTEAQQQNKPLLAHWAHLTIHGALHLLGYDHIKSKDAAVMEPLEIMILKQLGISNPYE